MEISRRLIELIERHADKLARGWVRDVQQHPGTPTYHTYDAPKLYHSAYEVYSHLGGWISEGISTDELAEHYVALGERRRAEGFRLSEVIQALTMTRRHVWLEVREEGLLDTAYDVYQAMELSNRVIVFFDRAVYYTAVGYESDK